ncbi:MAG: hypothetical protein E6J64_22875 [Deltaproteobacteria bacterium]|nr:MAG: hypothetical protein E6J64_22875 [Deltaproteobacteria bacterium]
MIRRLLRLLRPAPKRPPRQPEDPRVSADPWLAGLFAQLGDRYRLGSDGPDGAQVLRRTARARFNPMQVWLRPADRVVLGDYQVRAHGDGGTDHARTLLDVRVTPALRQLGLESAGELVEEWGGHVLTRRYQGRCDDPSRGAAAVRYMCQESEQLIDTAAE